MDDYVTRVARLRTAPIVTLDEQATVLIVEINVRNTDLGSSVRVVAHYRYLVIAGRRPELLVALAQHVVVITGVTQMTPFPPTTPAFIPLHVPINSYLQTTGLGSAISRTPNYPEHGGRCSVNTWSQKPLEITAAPKDANS